MTELLNEGFEDSGVLSGYNIEAITGGVTRSTTKFNKGLASCKFVINEADTGYGGGSAPHRAEIHSGVDEYEFNQDYWLGMNVYLENWVSDPEPEQIIQFHNVPNFGAGETWGTLKLLTPFGIQIKNNVYEIVHGFVQDIDAANPNGATRSNRVSAGAITNNGWTKWVIHCRWHYSTGILEVWKDDVLVYSKTGNTYYNDETGPYHKVGIYKWPWVYVGNVSTSTQRIMYLDNWKIVQGADATYSDVNPTVDMVTSSLENIKVVFTEAGQYSVIHRVTANFKTVENVTDIVVKPDPTPVTPPVNPYPPDDTYTAITVPALVKPPYNIKTVDNIDYGDGVQRWVWAVTDPVVYGTKDPQIHYSKTQPYNFGQTLFLADGKLSNGVTGAVIRKMTNGDGVNPQWSRTEPYTIYCVADMQLFKLTINPTTFVDTRTTLYNFKALGWTALNIGESEGVIDNNDEYIVLQGTHKVGSVSTKRVILYNLQTNAIVKNVTYDSFGAGSDFDWITVSKSGNYIIGRRRNHPSNLQHAVYDLDFNLLRTLHNGSHGDCGFDSSGNEVYVTILPIKMSRLDNGTATALLSPASVTAINGTSGGHLSCPYGREGWAYVSFGEGKRELIAVKLDGSETVERFGCVRDAGNIANDNKGCPSPDGTIFLVNAVWRNTTAMLTYAFQRKN